MKGSQNALHKITHIPQSIPETKLRILPHPIRAQNIDGSMMLVTNTFSSSMLTCWNLLPFS